MLVLDDVCSSEFEVNPPTQKVHRSVPVRVVAGVDDALVVEREVNSVVDQRAVVDLAIELTLVVESAIAQEAAQPTCCKIVTVITAQAIRGKCGADRVVVTSPERALNRNAPPTRSCRFP